MKILNYLLLLTALLGSSIVSAEPTMNEASVNKMLSEIEDAVHKQDVAQLASYFTEDATITLDMPSSMGGSSTMSKRDYISMVKQGWAMPAKYTYEVKDVRIKIAADGKSAVATDVTIETIEMGGQVIASSRTHETVDIVIDNGALRIAKLYGKVKM